MQNEPGTKYPGLQKTAIPALMRQYGPNEVTPSKTGGIGKIIWAALREPMFVLLMISCVLYFVLNKNDEGIMMLVAMSVVTGIAVFQEVRSKKALTALKQLTDPRCNVIRDGKAEQILVAEVLPGDIISVEEGMRVPADAAILEANDLTLNESILTGESFPVSKSASEPDNRIFQGTIVNSGKCLALVEKTGNKTQLGITGKYISEQRTPRSALQKLAGHFVTRLAVFGLAGFLVLFIANLWAGSSFVQSLLVSLTLAMAVAPEEIPVALSSFMALGAFRLSKQGIITRQPNVIESLGSVTVICFDKTGTITQNKMRVTGVYDSTRKEFHAPSAQMPNEARQVLVYAALASELSPFDTMEQAIWEDVNGFMPGTVETYHLVHEYPLSGIPPMMTHIHQINDQKLVVAKGAVERILAVSRLSETEKAEIQNQVFKMAQNGNRVIAVMNSVCGDLYPDSQDEFDWNFAGLVSLSDPPKPNAGATITQLQQFGIKVKMITGDHPQTALGIARMVSIDKPELSLSGSDVMKMDMETLQNQVSSVNVFTRMSPDAKLKVIEALKANGETVAMTGDGINDGIALKSAHIGIAMGKRGTELAMVAADLILTDDNLRKIITGVKQGRKIFNNLQKAIGYIVAIHIPIILTAAVPVLLNWKYPNIFTPVHVIFLEIIMGPTCSIFFENEPAEKNLLNDYSYRSRTSLLPRQKLITSIVQGLIIACSTLGLGYYYMQAGNSLPYVRTAIFDSLLVSNIMLTFVSRSDEHTIIKTISYKNILAPILLAVSVIYFLLINNVPLFKNMFGIESLELRDLMITIIVAIASVSWIEIGKSVNHYRLNNRQRAGKYHTA